MTKNYEEFKIGDEVGDLEDRVSGLIFKIEGDLVSFIDEFHSVYNIRKYGLRKVSYMSNYEKSVFITENSHIFK